MFSGDTRWISEDPARDGANWYAYCSNNPLTFTDPNGLMQLEDGRPLPGQSQGYWDNYWRQTYIERSGTSVSLRNGTPNGNANDAAIRAGETGFSVIAQDPAGFAGTVALGLGLAAFSAVDFSSMAADAGISLLNATVTEGFSSALWAGGTTGFISGIGTEFGANLLNNGGDVSGAFATMVSSQKSWNNVISSTCWGVATAGMAFASIPNASGLLQTSSKIVGNTLSSAFYNGFWGGIGNAGNYVTQQWANSQGVDQSGVLSNLGLGFAFGTGGSLLGSSIGQLFSSSVYETTGRYAPFVGNAGSTGVQDPSYYVPSLFGTYFGASVNNTFNILGNIWSGVQGTPPATTTSGSQTTSFTGSSGSGGAAGPGGGSIICEELHRQGYLIGKIYEADEKFGSILNEKNKLVLIGYQFWAQFIVHHMKEPD